MRPTVFSASLLRRFLLKNRIATLPQLKQLLGTEADITVFRKLKELSYRTSYSHRGSFYTLDEIAAFDERGLWSFDSVWFSRHGTLVATAEVCVTQAPAGYFASELEDLLHVPVKEPLLRLVEQERIARQTVSGLYLYCASNPRARQQQLRARQVLLESAAAESVDNMTPHRMGVSPAQCFRAEQIQPGAHRAVKHFAFGQINGILARHGFVHKAARQSIGCANKPEDHPQQSACAW